MHVVKERMLSVCSLLPRNEDALSTHRAINFYVFFYLFDCRLSRSFANIAIIAACFVIAFVPSCDISSNDLCVLYFFGVSVASVREKNPIVSFIFNKWK